MAGRTLTRRAAEQTAELAACSSDAATACEPASNWSAWGTGFGGAQWLNAEAASGAPAAQQTIGGGAFGGDYRADPQTLFGAAVGLSSSNYLVNATGASGQATGAHFGIYGLYDAQTFYVNAALRQQALKRTSMVLAMPPEPRSRGAKPRASAPRPH